MPGPIMTDDPHLNGHAHIREDQAPPEELLPPPAIIADWMSSCARFVEARYGVRLDGTQDTLSLLDQYVRDARAEIVAKPETLELLTPTIGAYLGEVLRTSFGGEWFAEGDPPAWRLFMASVYLAFNPIGMAREALTLADEPGWHAHLATDPAEQQDLDARLAALPEVEVEEYYLPTTRFDVVHIAFEALRAAMAKNGTPDVRFTREDYE